MLENLLKSITMESVLGLCEEPSIIHIRNARRQNMPVDISYITFLLAAIRVSKMNGQIEKSVFLEDCSQLWECIHLKH